MITSGVDHIALTVPYLDEQIDRFTTQFGMVIQSRTERFALIGPAADVAASGLLTVIGCVALASTLPSRTALTGTGVLSVGALIRAIRHQRR